MRRGAAAAAKVSLSEYKLRLSTYEDIPALRYIEAQAGQRFRDVGLDKIADHNPLEAEEHALAIEEGLSFVVEADEEPVGFLVADWMDEALHIAEISVHPNHGGHRLGEVLINAAKGLCAEKGKSQLTLSTFRDVPWNAPYYTKLGFEEIDAAYLGKEHRAMKEAQDIVFDQTPRVFMNLKI
ncbi:MAG: GNAT family N-acetyltransferase [Sphingomonadales bacterium]|jgi:GNAT superfamily N-acetyltransferase